MNDSTKLNAWKDWTQALVLMLSILRKTPLLTVGLVVLSVLAAIIPDMGEYRVLQFIGHLALYICFTSLTCHSQKARWAELNGEKWEASVANLSRVAPMSVAWAEYSGAIWIGLMLLVVPGVILAARGSLLLALVCIEKRGPLDAFSKSVKLTRGKFLMIGRYLALPLLALVVLFGAAPLVAGLIDPASFEDNAFTSWEWSMEHIPVILILAVRDCFGTLALLTVSILQVNLYAVCKSAQPSTGDATA